ncbi:diguanylate cyclase (GGDEF) domain-containing protein [Desulfovibrio sp. 3_1_syn3]|uniref:sensor domain-containing diguanylate cyclase n=1 Tax=Desulfovibrio sp. 3_1_syn3 TaxID=457398 RepID=UPI0001E12688|nr:diguanylate cyclase [Desulfovibrio sp. 3_1_syn3]EFL86947.1 diguanylate cyclase (GGDEF) domain-containing protein [Desulfovibrio sp. 3_1_syn3]
MNMKIRDKNQAIFLGVRVGFIFLLTVIVIIFAAYYTLSRNFQTLLTNYTIKLVQAMVAQGVDMVESELEIGRKEAAMSAASFDVANATQGSESRFPRFFPGKDTLRMVYVSETRTITSDGRKRTINVRPDIRAAFGGDIAVHGPYFNEDNEFVICYSAPVIRNGKIVGALSIEKNGYIFCRLIQSIRFVNTGESYIINAQGTDIAVSDPRHMEWVTSRYNAKKILSGQEDAVTRRILELEQKGLDGKKGIGTYYWKNGLVYVIYEPVPSVGWVLFGGLREEELASMTQSVFFTSISKGPALKICLAVVFLLTVLIIYWIISSMKKSAEINKKLEIIANHDALTGLLNRRFIETGLAEEWKYPIRASGQAALFMLDIDNFKKYNDFYGHLKGDDCLRQIAATFKKVFDSHNGYVIRYGGEEFIAVIFLVERKCTLELGNKICRLVEGEALPDADGGVVTVSVGMCHIPSTVDISLSECIQIADKALYQAKTSGKNRAVLLDSPQQSHGATPLQGISDSTTIG